MCGFGCGNENIIWILLLLCCCGNNDGCGSWGDSSSWLWILILLLRQQQEQQHRQCLRVLITRQKGCFNKSKPCFRPNILWLPYFAGACLILRRKNRNCHTFPFTIKGR